MKQITIMLSAKRCGSTAIFNLFQKHPDVKILNVDQEIINWEPQFWLYALKAIAGDPQDIKNFNDRLKNTLGFEDSSIEQEYNEDLIFKIFDKILEKFGPNIFDKSPQYLNSRDALNLLSKYQKMRTDVKIVIFAFIRHPLDAITSQHELWKQYTKEKSLAEREKNWLANYKNLEELQKIMKIKLYKYEEFCSDPKKNTEDLMNYCGLRNMDFLSSHLKTISLGRYFVTPLKSIKNWKISNELKLHMKKYGYNMSNDEISLFQKIKIFLSSIKRIIVPLYRNLYK